MGQRIDEHGKMQATESNVQNLPRPRTRIDEMRIGQRFRSHPIAGGEVWTLNRREGGAQHCTRERDGFKSCFAGCAEGEVLLPTADAVAADWPWWTR